MTTKWSIASVPLAHEIEADHVTFRRDGADERNTLSILYQSINEFVAKQVPPPNPLYELEYVCSLDKGRARLTVSAPGGKIDPQDASDLIAWMELLLTTFKRKYGANA